MAGRTVSYLLIRTSNLEPKTYGARIPNPRSPPHHPGTEDSGAVHSSAGARAGSHLFLDHRSHQLDRPAAEDAADLDDRLRLLLHARSAADDDHRQAAARRRWHL